MIRSNAITNGGATKLVRQGESAKTEEDFGCEMVGDRGFQVSQMHVLAVSGVGEGDPNRVEI